MSAWRSQRRSARNTAWFVGTRGDALRLGPLFQSMFSNPDRAGDSQYLVTTGEHGMALYQALDHLRIRPHDEFELRANGEDPAIRLQALMEQVERFVRQHRVDQLIFTGFGPTAAAAALVAHGRAARACWIRPPDPAQLIERLRWERGLSRIIHALEGAVFVFPWELQPAMGAAHEVSGRNHSLPPPITNRRPEAPLAVIHIGRYLWSICGALGRVIESLAQWARAVPEADWLVLRSLDARFEGTLGSMKNRPCNLLGVPPLPYPGHAKLLGQAGVIVTDTLSLATEAVLNEIPLAALGEDGPEATETARLLNLTPKNLLDDRTIGFLKSALETRPNRRALRSTFADSEGRARQTLKDWLAVGHG